MKPSTTTGTRCAHAARMSPGDASDFVTAPLWRARPMRFFRIRSVHLEGAAHHLDLFAKGFVVYTCAPIDQISGITLRGSTAAMAEEGVVLPMPISPVPKGVQSKTPVPLQTPGYPFPGPARRVPWTWPDPWKCPVFHRRSDGKENGFLECSGRWDSRELSGHAHIHHRKPSRPRAG